MTLSKAAATFLVILTLCSTLITSDHFIYPVLTSYFLFSLLSKVVLIYSLVLSGLYLPHFRVKFNTVTVVFLIWIAYVYSNALWFNGESGNLKTDLLLDGFLFFISLSILRSLDQLILRWIVRSLTIALFIESAICILQWLGIAESLNANFSVTGSQTNPNVTAMFLTLGTPIIWNELLHGKHLREIFIFIVCSAILVALLLLECRTAIIGAFIIALIFLGNKYSLPAFFRSPANRGKAIAFTLLLTGGAIFFGKWMYERKQASADGRVEIWKTSLQMIKERPFSGYGYGLFERNYNLYHAAHLPDTENTSAPGSSFVRMAYNELLENAVEGGVAGAALLLLLSVSAVYCYFRFRQCGYYFSLASYTAIVAFFIMSMVNFTLQAVAVFALFIFFLSNLGPRNFIIPEPGQKKTWQLKIAIAALFLLSAGLLYRSVRLSSAFREHKKAILLMKQGDTGSAVAMLRPLKETLKTCESYFAWYGNALFRAGELDEAALAFADATKLTSHPDIYLNLGFCHQQSGNWKKAEENFLKALRIMPERFLPRYALMELHKQANRTEDALKWAHAIVDLPPKIPSKEVDLYKSKAESYIQQNTN